MDHWIKPAFTVIGLEGATCEGPGFIQRLWEQANGRFAEVAALAKTNPDGSLCGIWGAMSDMSRRFMPWEDGFTKGLYLAGVECRDGAEPPAGWTRWHVPGYEYLRVETDGPEVFMRTLAYLQQNDIPLAGAVHDFTDPTTGKGYMLFPIRRLDGE